MPVSWLRANASGTRFQAPDNVKGQARIGARIACECGEVVPIVTLDLTDALAYLAGERLAFAEHLARHRIKRVVIHAYEGTA
jgi:hypothetical protein